MLEGGIVKFAEIHFEEGNKENKKMLKREKKKKNETSNQQTKAAQTVGVHPSSRAIRFFSKLNGTLSSLRSLTFP